jgi:hypothetical protein
LSVSNIDTLLVTMKLSVPSTDGMSSKEWKCTAVVTRLTTPLTT